MKKINEKELEKFGQIIDSTTDAVMTTDVNGVITSCNSACKTIYGYTQKELIGKNVSIFYSKEELPKLDLVIKNLLKGKRIPSIELNLVRKNRKIVPVSLALSALKNGEGRIYELVGFARDITEKRKSERLLKSSQKKLFTWLENSPVCTKIVDLDFNLQYMSHSGVESLKINDVTKLYGKPYPFDSYIEPFRSDLVNNLKKAKRTGETIKQEVSIFDEEKNILWFHSSIVPIKDSEGKVEYFMIISVNTTKRNEIEKELKSKNELLDQTGKIALVGGWELDAKTLKGSWTDQVAKIYDLDVKETRGLEVGLKYYGKNSRPIIEKAVQNAIKKGIPYDLELELISAKGVRKWVRSTGRPVLKDGKIVKLRGAFQDVTEKKKAEGALMSYKQGFDNSPNSEFLISYINNKPKIVHVNKGFVKLYGYSEKEVVNKNPNILKSGALDDEYYKKMWKDIIDPKVGYWRDEITNKTKNGKLVNVILTISTIFDKNKKPIRFTASHVDVTARRKAEMDVRNIAEKFSSIFNLSPISMAISTKKEGIFLDINDVYVKSLGYTREEVIGKSSKDINIFVDYNDRKKFINEIKEKGFAKGIEIKIRRKDSAIRLALFSAVPIKAGGEDLILTIAEDITEKKKAEEDLRKLNLDLDQKVKKRTFELKKANEDLKQLDVAKSDFLNTISHELKTPLTAMIAHLDVLGDIKRECINKGIKQKQCGLSFDTIKRNNGQLVFFIDNLLEVARMQSKTFKLDVSDFNIRDLVLEVVGDLVSFATLKGLKISYSVNKELMLRADRNRVREILSNLISNSIKFTKMGTIAIRVRKGKNFVSIAVQDNGIGIRKEDVPNLFKKFFRVKNGVKGGGVSGTGLGLSIVNSLARAHDGRVFVKSQFGKGSTFIVKLPIVGPTEKKSLAKKVAKKKVVAKKKIMKGGLIK